MFNLTDHKIYVTYAIYNPDTPRATVSKRDSEIYNRTLRLSYQDVMKFLNAKVYEISDGHGNFFELVDLKEIVINEHSYKFDSGRMSGAAAIKKINGIVDDHFNNVRNSSSEIPVENFSKTIDYFYSKFSGEW